MEERLIPHQVGYDPYYKVWHASREHMLIYMHTDGGCIVTHEKIYPIERGVLCFIGAGKDHYTMPDTPLFYDRTKVFLTKEELKRLRPLFPERSPLAELAEGSLLYAVVSADEEALIEEIFAEMQRAKSNTPYGNTAFFAGCLRLFALLGEHARPERATPPTPIAAAIDYINRHISEALRLEEIGRVAHMSKHHFCRRFKAATGATVMEYVLQTRLTLAKQMLLKEEASVGTVSEACGFGSISYFCRTFKADTGMSPLAYRKSML